MFLSYEGHHSCCRAGLAYGLFDRATAEVFDASGWAEPVGMAGAMEPVEELPMEPPVMDEPEPVMEMPAEPVTQPAMAASGDIRSQPANHYAVQVVASSSMENLMNFAKVNGLSDQWTAETMVNGKTWYVLLQGIYATKAEADAALSAAQSRFDTQPWIRTVGSLQSVMTP